MKVLLVANGQDGAGKTTLATTLASALAAGGRRVAIADADPDRASLTWLARRPSEAPAIHMIDCAPPPPRFAENDLKNARLMRRASWWRELWRDIRGAARRNRIEWLIIDAPVNALSQESGVRGLASKADLVIAPVAPGASDENATRRFLDLLRGANSRRAAAPGLLVVANRVRRRLRSERRLPDAGERFFARLGQDPVAQISEGAAYPQLTEEGLGLFDPQVDARAAPQAKRRLDRSGARMTARLRSDWGPLLQAIGIPAQGTAGSGAP